MTENIEKAMMAINKWIFFGWNYKSVMHEWECSLGQKMKAMVPEFLAKVDWNCSFVHMYNKWLRCTTGVCEESGLYLIKFYVELDLSNRIKLLKWVLENYHDERPLFYPD